MCLDSIRYVGHLSTDKLYMRKCLKVRLLQIGQSRTQIGRLSQGSLVTNLAELLKCPSAVLHLTSFTTVSQNSIRLLDSRNSGAVCFHANQKGHEAKLYENFGRIRLIARWTLPLEPLPRPPLLQYLVN